MDYFKHSLSIKEQFLIETKATLYMTLATAIIAGILGLVLGVALVVTGKGGIQIGRAHV